MREKHIVLRTNIGATRDVFRGPAAGRMAVEPGRVGINVEEIDPQCLGINLVANQAREARIDVAASNSFGFGGVNTCIVLKKYPPEGERMQV